MHRRGGVHRIRGASSSSATSRTRSWSSVSARRRSTWRDAIRDFSPSLYHYVGHLHIAVSGFIAATGVAVLFLVAYGVRRGELWAWVGATVAPVLGLLVALPDHYPNNFDTIGHLAPIYDGDLRGGCALGPARGPRSSDRLMATDVTTLCPKCGGLTDGWKCAICGSVASEHDEHHVTPARIGIARSSARRARRPTCIAHV